MSRQARQRRRPHGRGGRAKVTLTVGGTAFAAVLIAVLAGISWGVKVAHSEKPVRDLKRHVSGGLSSVYAANDERLGFIQADVLRTPVGWNSIPPGLRAATAAIQDQRFYHHDRVDFEGIIRAAVKD